ncbi:CDP-glycerol glycerophosphotransferase family protein [Streptomyces sp. RS10V-4]|uniref:bifunctional glycosyltransferase/CDP-glycerol:glycerophosphate glycerophosphotransferase n=1 Tax=Streptomyces rhizoryzae TaxID=2932493 RepID=UPI0020043D13|nr:CDP-glycerol glycerophosphotransferase family protein [Streptomyces rhizoryzae]MCK7623903.1 CDP-glycerol glycerophosphotransferase family protein [Streptomyces rhizoryzae]
MKPRLTVVVPVPRGRGPVHEVEECLASVAAQTLAELDVVLVDDGLAQVPPDGPVRRWTERDPRFRVVHHPGGGRGGAWNAGARHAFPHTAYLAFLAPEDVLLPRAYADLAGLLDKSGADLATGNVYRLGPGGRTRSADHRADRETVLRTHVTEEPELLADHFVRNKVFRRAFWDRHRLAFPEGEGGADADAAVALPAHFLAEAVDVLREHVCYWRLPEGPARHRRPTAQGVRDRFAVVARVRALLDDPAHPERARFRAAYDRGQLTGGLLDLVAAVPGAAPEVRTAFLDCARDFLARTDPGLLRALPVELRMRWYLVRSGRLADLVALLGHEARNPGGFAVAGPPLRKRAVLPVEPPVALPAGVVRLGRADFPVRAEVREAVWRGGVLLLRGWAYLRNLPAGSRHGYVRTAVLSCGRRRIVLPVRTVQMPEATAASGQELHCYDWSGFELRVDPVRLRRGGRPVPGEWRLEMVLASAGVVRSAELSAPESGSGAAPAAYEGVDGVRVVPRYVAGGLRIAVARRTRRLVGRPAVAAGALDLVVSAPGPAPEALRLTHQGSGTVVSFPVEAAPEGARGTDGADGPGRAEGADGADRAGGAPERGGPGSADGADGAHGPDGPPGTGQRAAGGGRFAVRVRLDALDAARPARDGAPAAIPPPHTETWRPELVLPGGATDPVACPPGTAPAAHPLPHGRELVVAADPAGDLVLHDRIPQAYVDRVVWRSDGTLLLAGTLPDAAPPAPELVLRHGAHATEAVFPAVHDGGRFHCALPLAALPSLAGEVPLREGRWTVHLRARGAAASPLDPPVRCAPSVFDGLPVSRTVRGKPFTLDRVRYDEVLVAAGPAVPPVDRGPYRRRVLREQHYPLHRSRPLRDTVLYSSFGGRAYGDSPRAVHEELVRRGVDVTHLWAVRDAQAAVPPTARPVVVGSAAWHGALAHSHWIVTNTHLPRWFVRRAGQRVIQTWHGTPLKRIGADLAGTVCGGLAHLAPRPRLGRQWSVLLSPNAASTPVLRSALGFPGRLLETGLPRIDALHAADRDEVAAAVRARLGIRPDQRVVLYAPTPRDDVSYDASHHRLHLPLDLAAARAALAGGHVLLVRSHPQVPDRLPAHHAPFALDVSAYPDATELLLAADVLVTDYSSLAVDFANTGRPMLFLTPDLTHYRDTLRGFSVDFEALVPGPLLASTGELIEALGDLPGVARASAAAYAEFRRVFCHLDDGGAAGRVADLIAL